MEIDGESLRIARRRAGFRSQAAAARAVGVSPRLFGPWETHGVPPEYVEAVRRAFWQNDATATLDLSTFADIDLLTEIGRRFAQYRRERDEAVERLAEQGNSHPLGWGDEEQREANLPEPPSAQSRFTGRRPRRPDLTET